MLTNHLSRQSTWNFCCKYRTNRAMTSLKIFAIYWNHTPRQMLSSHIAMQVSVFMHSRCLWTGMVMSRDLMPTYQTGVEALHIAAILGDKGTVFAFNVEQRLLPMLNEKIITFGVNSKTWVYFCDRLVLVIDATTNNPCLRLPHFPCPT